MKTINWLMIPMLAVAMLAAVAVLPGCKPSDSTAAPGTSSVKYTCSMHPEVIQDAPGNCPKCGMKLIEKK